MSGDAFESVFGGLRSLFGKGTLSGMGEAVLLERYVAQEGRRRIRGHRLAFWTDGSRDLPANAR